MNLGVIESHLLRALQHRLDKSVELHVGPPRERPTSGLRAEVFIHAARFSDLGGRTEDGAQVVRRPVEAPGGMRGFVEERPIALDVEVTCVCAQHAHAHALAGLVAAPLLEALETLHGAVLGDPTDPARRLRFADHVASLYGCTSKRELYNGVEIAQVLLTLRMRGFLQIQLLRKGGLHKTSVYDLPLRLTLKAGPSGVEWQREHVIVHNDSNATLDLGGWSVRDAAERRPHRFTFTPLTLLPAGASLRLWSVRGTDDAENVYWGRRKAVWNNTGDVAMLVDPDGVERARAQYVAPTPARKRTS